jgi:hypothetical protein
MEVIEEYMKKEEYNPTTIYAYKNGLKKFLVLFKPKDLLKSQESILNNLEKFKDNNNTKILVLKSIMIYRKALSTKKKPLVNDILSKEINNINTNIVSGLQEKKKDDNDGLPSLKEIEEKTEKYYDDKKYREYVIMRLMTSCVCRNMDLNAEIINEDEKQDENKNYIVIHKKNKKNKDNHIEFIRNNYKTKKSFGSQTHIYFDDKLFDAVSKIDGKYLIPEIHHKNIARYIKKVSWKLGEGKIAKIILKNKNTLGEASSISKSRGTSLFNLQQHYNIVE